MRFLVDVRPDGADWRVTVRGEGGPPVLGERRMRRLEAPGAIAVPAPPAEYALDLPEGAPHRALCLATGPQLANDMLRRLATRTATPGEATAFGRYLFASLLDDAPWQAIRAAAGAGAIELAIGWPIGEAPLSRLPWELMHGATGFLGTLDAPRTAITRRVLDAGGAAAARSIVVRPRVLFVIGVSPERTEIQAGAEYLGLLRRIRAGGAALATRVLVPATPLQLADAIRRFAPSIVHFISHGAIGADGRGRINLMSEEVRDREEPLTADSLVALLGPEASRPSVLVLNACETGGGDAIGAALATPLAAELIAGGIPIVVGQGGRVADRACRLFTRRFYEALLAGEPLPEATAEGRRSARALGGDPATTIDWALPSLFMGEGVAPATTLAGAARLQLMESVATRMCTISNPASFCGRLECVEHFGEMLHDRGNPAIRVLAYEVAEREAGFAKPRYGKTRLLQQLASVAVRDGVVPCFLTFLAGDQKPKDALSLGLDLVNAIDHARVEFALPTVDIFDCEVKKLQQWDTSRDPAPLHADVRQALGKQRGEARIDARLVASAIRVDLARLAADVRAGLPAGDGGPVPVSPVVVLIDEVHEFGDAARELLEIMLTVDGFGTRELPIPVALAFSGGTVAGESATAAQAISAFFEAGKSYVNHVPLRAFQSPIENRLAYRQYLLHQETPLVFTDVAQDEAKIEAVLTLLQEHIRGVPSRMELTPDNGEVQAVVKAARQFGPMRTANDEDALREIEGTAWPH